MATDLTKDTDTDPADATGPARRLRRRGGRGSGHGESPAQGSDLDRPRITELTANLAVTNLQRTDPTLAALISAGQPYVRCSCGFVAVSTSPVENRRALEEHPCRHRQNAGADEDERVPWYTILFTPFGVFIVVIVASAAVSAAAAIFGGGR